MNSPSRHDSAIDEQAATWAARLEDDVLEASERAALDAWLAQSPEHRAQLSRYCQLSADLEEQLPQLVASGAITMPVQKRPAARIISFPRVIAVALAAAAAVILGIWVARPGSEVQTFAAPIEQRSSFTLSDSTRVELNAHTSLRFENSGKERHVQLAGGEALFMVAKDKTRPFIIDTPAGSVRVTGTTFNVRTSAGAGALDVTVVEGSVQVRPAQKDGPTGAALYSLSAGDHLSVRPSGVSQKTLSAAALEDELAWRDGRVVFNDVPLREAAARFAYYHGRTLNVAPQIGEEPVGGFYNLDDLSGFLAGLELTLPVKAGFNEIGVVSIVPRDGN